MSSFGFGNAPQMQGRRKPQQQGQQQPQQTTGPASPGPGGGPGATNETATVAGGQQAAPNTQTTPHAGMRTGDYAKQWQMAQGGNQGPDPQEMWANVLAQNQANMQSALEGTYADQARAGRTASAMNAAMGGGIGGNWQAGQAQVQLGGMQQRQDTARKYSQQDMEIRMAQLDSQIRQAEAQKDRELQRELEAERRALQRDLYGAGMDQPIGTGEDGAPVYWGTTASGGTQKQDAAGNPAAGWKGKSYTEDDEGNKTYGFDI